RLAGAAGDLLPPRALGRLRLPPQPPGSRDPDARSDLRGGRRLRLDDERAAVPPGALGRGRARRDRGRRRNALRPFHRRRVSRADRLRRACDGPGMARGRLSVYPPRGGFTRVAPEDIVVYGALRWIQTHR